MPLAAAEKPATRALRLAKAVKAEAVARDAADAVAFRAYPVAADAVAYPAAADSVRFPVAAVAVRCLVAADAVPFPVAEVVVRCLVAADAVPFPAAAVVVRSLVAAPVATRAPRMAEPTPATEHSSRSGCARARVRAQPEIVFTTPPSVHGPC
jgi:hypothetical protein